MQDNLQANNQAWSPGLDRSGTAEHAQQRARRTQSNVIHKTPPPTGLTITAADGVVTDALQYRRGSVQRRNMKGVASLPAGPIRKSESDGSLNGQDGTRSSHDSTKSPKGTRPAKRFSVLNSPQIRRVENLFGLVRKSSSKGDLAGSNSDNDEDSATRLEQKGGTSSKASQLSEKPNKLSKKGSKPATLNQVTTKGIENAAFVMANIWNPLRSGFQFLKPTFPQIVSELEEHASYSNIFHSGVMCVKINTVMWRLSVGMLTARNLIVFTLVRTQDMLGEIIVSISPINIIRCEAIESKRDHPDHLFNCYLRDGRTLKCATTADWRRDKWVTEINAVLKRNEGVVKVTKDHLKLEKWSRAMSSVSASSNEMSEGDAQEGTFKDGVAVLMVALARSQAAPGENCGSVLLGIRPEVGAKIVFCRPQSAMEEVRIFLTSGNYASINLNRSLTSIKHYIRIGGIPDDKPSHIPNYELVEILKPDDLSPVVNPILEESNARQLTPNARLKKYLHAVCVYIHTYELLCVGLSLLLVGIVLPSIVADYIVVVVGTAVVCLFLHLHVMPDLDTVKDHETYYELTINGTLRFSDCSDDDESDTGELEEPVDEMEGFVMELQREFPDLHPVTAERFIISQDCNMKEAIKARREFEEITYAWNILTNTDMLHMFQMGMFYLHGVTRDNAPLVVIRFERLNLKLMKPIEICQFVDYVLRRIDRIAPAYQRVAIIMDFHGFQYSKQVDFGFYSEAAGTLAKTMVEVLDKVYCVNTPLTIRSVWMFVATFLNQSTIDKIKFLKHGKNSAIQTTIDLRYIPRAYGGESNLEITAEQAKEFTAETIHYGWVGPDMVPLINDIEDITP